jgi:hypothetical protein
VTLSSFGVDSARVWKAATEAGFIDLRDKQNIEPIWPFFRAFAAHINSKRFPQQAQLHTPTQ